MPRTSKQAIERNRAACRDRAARDRALNRKKQQESRDRKRNGRQFVGWDGEGYRSFSVDARGVCTVLHHYMLFGSSSGHHVRGKDLSTRECLEVILHVESLDPDAIHVGFAFEYDVNMILKDLSWARLAILNVCGRVRWEGYTIEHTPHKMFSVRKGDCSARIYDVFGFFHSSYMNALRKYEVGEASQLEKINAGKKERSRFTYQDIDEVTAYWREEISLLPPLMDKIRTAAYAGGFFISEWHGPGALASYALKYNGVKQYKSKNVPVEVRYAIQSAYAGGRFQGWRCGLYDGPVYTADINSAYIFACSLLPRLDRGGWIRTNPRDIERTGIARFGLYRIAFDAGKNWESSARKRGIPAPPYPLFHRDNNGRLTWPRRTEGWYWSPEARLVYDSPHATILEAWVFHDDGSMPFQWVYDSYHKRLELQRAGNPAEKAYKWSLAAMYGAFARRVGWDKKTRTAPSSHELAWAGFITSWCRAAVYDAAAYAAVNRGLISIDTDGVTSTVPFDESLLVNGVGDGLGQWKLEEYTGILQWQNGIYWLRGEDGEWQDPKTRGIPKGSIPFDVALEAYKSADWRDMDRPLSFELQRNRFVGYREALQGQFGKWRQWVPEQLEVTFGGTGKGRHIPQMCGLCWPRNGYPVPAMHTITGFGPSHVESSPHRLPWLEDLPVLPDKSLDIWGDDDQG